MLPVDVDAAQFHRFFDDKVASVVPPSFSQNPPPKDTGRGPPHSYGLTDSVHQCFQSYLVGRQFVRSGSSTSSPALILCDC